MSGRNVRASRLATNSIHPILLWRSYMRNTHCSCCSLNWPRLCFRFIICDSSTSTISPTSPTDKFVLHWHPHQLWWAFLSEKIEPVDDSFLRQSNDNCCRWHWHPYTPAVYHRYKLLKCQVWLSEETAVPDTFARSASSKRASPSVPILPISCL